MKKRILIIAIVTALLLSACTMGKATGSGNANKDLKDDKASEEAVKLTEEEYKQLREKLCNDEEADLPKMFDLRDYNLVTPVKDQGQYGLCWAYAAISAMESNALTMGFGEYDLSEYHIGYLAYNDPNGGFSSRGASDGWLDVGGYNEYSIAPFMRGHAPASEDKYPSDDVQRRLPVDAINDNVLNGDSSYFVQASRKDEIKRFIIEYGAVTAYVDADSWYMDESGNWTDIRMSAYFNFDTNAVYSSMTSIDHVVTVIGWDDNYLEDNFKTKPDGPGAWICKNSWGNGFGDGGYFYLSYYDGVVNPGKEWCVYITAPKDSYDYQYQYDGGYGAYEVERTTGVAMAFTVAEDQTLTGLKIYPKTNVNHKFNEAKATVEIYRNVESMKNLETAEKLYSAQTLLKYAGYQTIELNEGVNVNKDDVIYVVVTFDNELTYRLDASTGIATKDDNDAKLDFKHVSAANPGETFIKVGDNDWEDCVVRRPDSSLCMKVMARTGHDREVYHRFKK